MAPSDTPLDGLSRRRPGRPRSNPASLRHAAPLNESDRQAIIEECEKRIADYVRGDVEALRLADPVAIAIAAGFSPLRLLRAELECSEFAAGLRELRRLIRSLMDWKARGEALRSSGLRDTLAVLDRVGGEEWERTAPASRSLAGAGGSLLSLTVENPERIVDAVASLRAGLCGSGVPELPPAPAPPPSVAGGAQADGEEDKEEARLLERMERRREDCDPFEEAGGL